jgi:cation diffusion facilitator CzcD-associated flavoprotein CzcO
MAILNTTAKVLIIGTGLSGLALAQILRKAEVDFEIFERDDGTRHQGWTIALDEFVTLRHAGKMLD